MLSGTKRTLQKAQSGQRGWKSRQWIRKWWHFSNKSSKNQRKPTVVFLQLLIIILHIFLLKRSTKWTTSELLSFEDEWVMTVLVLLASCMPAKKNASNIAGPACSWSIPSARWISNLESILEMKSTSESLIQRQMCYNTALREQVHQTMADFSISMVWIAFCSSVASIEPGSNVPFHAPSPKVDK